jgi:hypothetical protein
VSTPAVQVVNSIERLKRITVEHVFFSCSIPVAWFRPASCALYVFAISHGQHSFEAVLASINIYICTI